MEIPLRRLLLILAIWAPGIAALAQGGAPAPHNLYSSTHERADLATMQRLLDCGIQAVAEDSDFYDALATGFYVVISGPLHSRAEAEVQLERARACGIAGQTRMVRRRIAAH